MQGMKIKTSLYLGNKSISKVLDYWLFLHKYFMFLIFVHISSFSVGVYVSKTKYIRQGEQSLDGFYRAWHQVEYYR